jgi:lysozyme
MKTSERGRQLITTFEGEILHGYFDPVGIPTVGVGHVILPGEPYKVGKAVTRAESQRLLAQDLAKFEAEIDRLVRAPLNQNQYDALVSLVFNIGAANFKKSTVLRKLNQKDYQAAADAFVLWAKSGGHVLPGLLKRRKRERSLFLTPAPLGPETAGILGTSAPPVPEVPAAPFIERIFAPVQNVKQRFERLGVDPGTITKNQAVRAGLTKASGFLLTLLALFTEHWEFIVPGLVIVAVGAVYLTYKIRAARREV